MDTDLLLEKLNYLLYLGADPAVLRCMHGVDHGSILTYVLGRRIHRGNREGEALALQLAKIMRNHGCPPERPKPTSGGNRDPSVLQVAIYWGSSVLVEFLLDLGIDIDHFQDDSGSATFECALCNTCPATSRGAWLGFLKGRSPLLTALKYQKLEIAKMLVTRNPGLKLRGGEQDLAMEGGDDPELVTMLLQADPNTSVDVSRSFLEQAVLWRNTKSIRLLMSADSDGHDAVNPTTMLRAAMIVGDHDEVNQQITECEYDSRVLYEVVLQSHKSQDYHRVLERLLEIRPNASNDSYEVNAVASAAIHHDIYLMGILMKNLGQGPWIAHFPCLPTKDHDAYLSRWVPDGGQHGISMHVLNYAAELSKIHDDATVMKTLLDFNVSAKGMLLDVALSAEIWKRLIAAGADPSLQAPLLLSLMLWKGTSWLMSRFSAKLKHR